MCNDKDNMNHKCNIFSGEQCPICLEEISEQSGFVQTPCGHKFGTDCFIAFLATYNTISGSLLINRPLCPICRQDLTLPHLIEEDSEYPQYVILPYNPGSNNECGHHLSYKTIMRITRLRPGESIKCGDDYGECDVNCQYVIYERPQTGQELEEVDPTVRLQTYARTYNIMSIFSGMSGLAYSS